MTHRVNPFVETGHTDIFCLVEATLYPFAELVNLG
jgi:hypothetical protein